MEKAYRQKANHGNIAEKRYFLFMLRRRQTIAIGMLPLAALLKRSKS
jgi:hypothetical protein